LNFRVRKKLDHEINKAVKTVRGVLGKSGEEKLRDIKFKICFSPSSKNIKIDVTIYPPRDKIL
tara:strand:- start:249 stop:437 length:189 start_codon:yes stop_codon:yes gene_type:complete